MKSCLRWQRAGGWVTEADVNAPRDGARRHASSADARHVLSQVGLFGPASTCRKAEKLFRTKASHPRHESHRATALIGPPRPFLGSQEPNTSVSVRDKDHCRTARLLKTPTGAVHCALCPHAAPDPIHRCSVRDFWNAPSLPPRGRSPQTDGE